MDREACPTCGQNKPMPLLERGPTVKQRFLLEILSRETTPRGPQFLQRRYATRFKLDPKLAYESLLGVLSNLIPLGCVENTESFEKSFRLNVPSEWLITARGREYLSHGSA